MIIIVKVVAGIAAVWTCAYLFMRLVFPPKDPEEIKHLDRIGKRVGAIGFAVIALASLAYWMLR